MCKTYLNKSVEFLKEEGWELKGLPYLIEVNPDMIKQSHLEETIGKCKAYLLCSAKLRKNITPTATIIYGLRETEHKPKA